MIERNNENSPKSHDPVKFQQENENETPKFKLLYRKTPNPERDRSSGVSSDEETTSSSLAPIPEGLKKFGNNTRWTMSETRGDPSDTPFACGILGDSTGNIMSSLEELRKKYTLKNETSVTLKMNSANQMLDDILSSANMKNSINNNPQYRPYKKEEYMPKMSPETETSTTESSISHCDPCPYVADLSHLPIALDFYTPPCPRHYSSQQVLHSSLGAKDKDPITSRGNIDINQRKKSLVEKLQDLQIRCRLQSVYKNLQKTRNPFTKFRKDPESLNVSQGMNRLESESLNVSQGIPGCDGDILTDTEPVCQCDLVCPLSHLSKKMVLDLVEPSETSQTDSRSTERDDRNFMYPSLRKCTCPEVVPRCVCRDLNYQISETSYESTRQNSELASKTEVQIQTTQSAIQLPTKNENESSLLMEKEHEDGKMSKHSLRQQNQKGWKKYCSKERNLIERTDIYYFDHGNSAYYKTTDNHPMRYTECLVERTDEYATKFWAEFFGTIEIGIAFLISFVLQLYRFLFTSVIRSLTVGLLQIFSDYLFKPLLTIIFNGLIQPCLILVYNITTSFRDLCLPVSQIFGFFAKELASVVRSCRLVEVNQQKESPCICGNKV